MKPTHALWGFLAVSHSTIIHAATLTWDSNNTVAPVNLDGAGTWTTANSFHDGTNNVTWPTAATATDTAVFGNINSTPIGFPGTIDWAAGTTIGVGSVVYRPVYGNAVKYNVRGNTNTSFLQFNGATPSVVMDLLPSRPFGAMNAPMVGTAGIDISTTSNGIFEIGTQPNTITGNFRLKSGVTLSIGGDVSLGGATNGLNFDANSTLLARNAGANYSIASTHPITVAGGALGKFDVHVLTTAGNPLQVLTVAGPIGGAGGIQKEGVGTLALNTGSTFGGNAAVRFGTLNLNFANTTAPAAPTSDILPNTASLRLLGGTLSVTGKASTANTQTFSGTTLLPGASSLTSTAGATGGTTQVNLGGISRAGGSSLNIATIAAGTSYTSSSGLTGGILGGFGTLNNTDWLTTSAGVIGGLASYQTGTDATLWAATDNVSLAATPTTPLAGSATVNSLKYTATADVAIPAGQTLTLAAGGILVTGGAASVSGGNIQGYAGGDIVVHQHNVTNAATISSVIQNNTSPCAFTKSGAGALVLSGANTYTGNTFVNAGTLEVSSDANTGGGAVVTVRNGANLKISGATAFSSGKTFTFDTGSDTFGALQLGATATDVGQANIEVSNTAGATISGNFNVTSGTFVKNGAGTLTLTHNGSHQLSRLNGGIGTIIQDGGVVFNGGAGSEWYASQSEFVVGAGSDLTKTSTHETSVTVQSGKVTVGSWTGISRGNGTSNYQSRIVMTGGTWDTGNVSLGFANAVGAYATRPLLDLSNDSQFIVRDDALFSESGGSNATINVKNTSQLVVRDELRFGLAANALATINISDSGVASSGGPTRIGQGGTATVNLTGSGQLNCGTFLNIGNGGTATVNVGDSSTLSAGTDFNVGDTDNSTGTVNVTGGTVNITNFFLGKGGNIAGTPVLPAIATRAVINQSGGLIQNLSGAGGDWRIGGGNPNDAEVYGALVSTGGNFNSGARNLQIGAYGTGVMDVRGGTVVTNTTGGFPVIGRFAGGFGLLDVSSGSFSVGATGQLLIVGEAGTANLNVSNTGSVLVNSAPGAAGNGGGTGGVRLGHTAGASGTVSLNGGTLETTGLAKTSNAVNSFGFVYLNGGNLKVHAANTTFMQGLDGALVGPGGAKIDTNGSPITIGQNLAGTSGQSGVLTIPVATPGAGYMGPPVVHISGGSLAPATGARAVANMSGGTVTSITITHPGTGYLGAPTVALLGGGATTAATLGTATFGALPADGGLTKSGVGTLTLGGTNTYTGTTAVNEDTLLVNGAVAGPVTVAAGCTIGGSGTLGSTLVVNSTSFVEPGSTTTAGTLTTNGNVTLPGTLRIQLDGANADRLTVNGNLDLTGSTLEVESLTGGATQSSYTIVSYTGTLTGSLTLSGSLPATYTLFNDVANKAIKLVSAGNYGSWQAGFGLLLGTTGAPGADADSDQLPNAVEYVLGGDPTLPSTTLAPTQTLTPTSIIFTFNRADTSETPDTTVTVEASTNLAGFPISYTIGSTTANSSPGVTIAENGAAPDTVTVVVPRGTNPSTFVRLNVNIAP